jgi:hypothetical protein
MDVMIRWDAEPGDDEAHRIITFKDMRIEPGSFAREFAGYLKPAEPEPAPPSERKDVPSVNPTAAEFANWLTPPDALGSLDSTWSLDTKKNWILRRLASGEVKAATAKGVIHYPMWGARWHWFGNDFWQTGDLTFFDGPPDHFGRPILGVPCQKIEMRGLRFDPAGFPSAVETKTGGHPQTTGEEVQSTGHISKGARQIEAAEFETWLRPVAVLALFEGTNFHGAAKAVQEALIAKQVVAAAETLALEGATIHRAPVPASLWVGWYGQNDTRFWVTADHVRLMADRHGVIDPDRRIELFGVRFEPKGIEALLPERPPTAAGSGASGRRGGRRPRTTGEPIARVVKRLLDLPAPELASYKVDALTADLMAEFRALGLDPPHEDNVKRDASGILRALREGGAT